MGGAVSKEGLTGGGGKKVVVAVDESPVSLDTLRWAARSVLHPADELHLVTVLDTAHTTQVNYTETAPVPDANASACTPEPGALEYSNRFLEAVKERLQKEEQLNVRHVKLQPLVSCIGNAHDVGRAIAEYASHQKADICVVGSRGLGNFRRLMMGTLGLGSVSESVLRYAPCTVAVHKLASGLSK